MVKKKEKKRKILLCNFAQCFISDQLWVMWVPMCESRKQFGLITYHPANNTSLSFWGSIMHIYWQLNTNFSTFRGSEQMRKTNKQMKWKNKTKFQILVPEMLHGLTVASFAFQCSLGFMSVWSQKCRQISNLDVWWGGGNCHDSWSFRTKQKEKKEKEMWLPLL